MRGVAPDSASGPASTSAAGAATGAARVEVWWARASTDPGLERFLDDAERARAARLPPGPKPGFVTARALMRRVLSRRTGLAPTDVPIEATCRWCGGPHGRPRVVLGLGWPAVTVSLAHAEDVVVVAVADGGEVGVDVEPTPPPGHLGAADAERLAAEVLAPDERVQWVAAGRVPADLAQWWTRKEAVLKASGHGLAVPPASIRVSAPWAPPAVLAWDASEPLGGVVSLVDLAAVPGHVGSVAVLGAAALSVVEQAGDELLATG